MCGLAQWLDADGRQRRLDRVGMPSGATERRGECLKPVQPDLAQALAFVLHPLLIPVRQQVAGQFGQCYRVKVNPRQPDRRVFELPGERDQPQHVDVDVGAQLQS